MDTAEMWAMKAKHTDAELERMRAALREIIGLETRWPGPDTRAAAAIARRGLAEA